MENDVKKYYPHLDKLKGLAILLMVMAHVIAWSYPDYSFLTQGRMKDLSAEMFNASFVWTVIYSFHMPLLFFISGYLFYRSSQTYEWNGVKNMLLKRTNRLLIPYFTTGFFVLFLKGYYGYWFFVVLFILNVIILLEFFIEEKLKLNGNLQIVGHIFVFVILFVAPKFLIKVDLPTSLGNLNSLYYYYFVFMLGYSLHKWNGFEKSVQKPQWSLLLLFFYIALMVIVKYFGLAVKLNIFIPGTIILFLFGAFINKDWWGGQFLTVIGKNSMEIYVFHLFFVMPFKEVGTYILGIDNFAFSITLQLTYSLLSALIAIGFSLVMSKIVKSNKYLSFVLFGTSV